MENKPAKIPDSNTSNLPIAANADKLSGFSGMIVQARQKESIRGLKMEILQGFVLDAIKMAHFELKYKIPDSTELALMGQSLSNDLAIFFPTFSIDEVQIAFKMGVRGKFGEFQGLSIATFNRFLQNYVHCSERTNVIKAEKSKLHQPKPEPTEEEKRTIAIDAALEAFEKFKETQELTDFGNAIFRFLEKEGLISMTNERKEEIKKEVKKKLIDLVEFKLKTTSGNIRRNELKRRLDDLKTNKKAPELIFECRLQALKDYFDNLIKFDIHLKEKLND